MPRLRPRGPEPTLHDSEVITVELAGEFAGIDTDGGIYAFFRHYHRGEFPALARVDRTTFARQGANLWRVKQLLHGRVFRLLRSAGIREIETTSFVSPRAIPQLADADELMPRVRARYRTTSETAMMP